MWEPEPYETGRPMHEDKGERLPARAQAGTHDVATWAARRLRATATAWRASAANCCRCPPGQPGAAWRAESSLFPGSETVPCDSTAVAPTHQRQPRLARWQR